MFEPHVCCVEFGVIHMARRLRRVLPLPAHMPGNGPSAGEVLRSLAAQGPNKTVEEQKGAGGGEANGKFRISCCLSTEPGYVTVTCAVPPSIR